jgi:hypothetical protein
LQRYADGLDDAPIAKKSPVRLVRVGLIELCRMGYPWP